MSNTETKVYYKVVRADLTSANAPRNSYTKAIGSNVQYFIDEWTYPKIKDSKLFIFANREDASNFFRNRTNHKLFECIAHNPVKIEIEYLADHDISQFWRDPHKKTHGLKTPTGSYWCDSLKLTKELV